MRKSFAQLQTNVWFGLCRSCYEQVLGLLVQICNANNDSYGNLFSVHSFLDFPFFLCNYLGLLSSFFPTKVRLLVYEPIPISKQAHIKYSDGNVIDFYTRLGTEWSQVPAREADRHDLGEGDLPE